MSIYQEKNQLQAEHLLQNHEIRISKLENDGKNLKIFIVIHLRTLFA